MSDPILSGLAAITSAWFYAGILRAKQNITPAIGFPGVGFVSKGRPPAHRVASVFLLPDAHDTSSGYC